MRTDSSDSRQMPMKHHRRDKLIGVVVVCLLLAGILLLAVFSSSKGRWCCSPSQLRPSGAEAWETVTGPAQTSEEPDEDFSATFTVSSDEENFLVEHAIAHHPANPFAYDVREMTPGEALNVGGGTLTFCAMGTAYLDATQTMENDATYRFFDAELRRMTEEQAREFESYTFRRPGRDFRHAPFPGLQLGFKPEAIENVMFHGIRIFDASTRKELTGGYGGGTRQSYYWFDTRISLWHRTPVDIVLEVSYGPSKKFEFAPRVGEGFREGNFECRLLCVLEGADTYSSGSSSRDDTVTHRFPKAQPGKGGLRFVFACQPAASKMPVTLEFLDDDGKVLSPRGSSTSGVVHHCALQQPLEKVARIRARYRTQRARILIHLPYIPGLPEQNNAIDDLFDVYIPYVRLHSASQVGDFLMRTLQLRMCRQTGPIPADSVNSLRFPVEFSDATVRDIAQLYAHGGTLKVDIENERLLVQYPVPLGTRLKQFLQRMFGRNRGGGL